MAFAELFIFMAIVVLIARCLIPRFGGWNRAYDSVAKRYNAMVYRGYLFTRPSMHFSYGRTSVTVRSRRRHWFRERRQSDVELVWPDRKFKLIISSVPDNVVRRGGRSFFDFSRRPVEVNIKDSPFQSGLTIKSNQPEVAAQMLDSSVQWQIEQLRRHLGKEELVIEIRNGKMVVSKPGFVRNDVLLDDFIRFSLELFDRMTLSVCEGVEFINEARVKVVDDCVCPICSESIVDDLVMCVRCKTPHCLDCWQYNGQCATFACKETRFLKTGDSTTSA